MDFNNIEKLNHIETEELYEDIIEANYQISDTSCGIGRNTSNPNQECWVYCSYSTAGCSYGSQNTCCGVGRVYGSCRIISCHDTYNCQTFGKANLYGGGG